MSNKYRAGLAGLATVAPAEEPSGSSDEKKDGGKVAAGILGLAVAAPARESSSTSPPEQPPPDSREQVKANLANLIAGAAATPTVETVLPAAKQPPDEVVPDKVNKYMAGMASLACGEHPEEKVEDAHPTINMFKAGIATLAGEPMMASSPPTASKEKSKMLPPKETDDTTNKNDKTNPQQKKTTKKAKTPRAKSTGGRDLLGGSMANITTAGLSARHSKQDLLGGSIANITSGMLAPTKKKAQPPRAKSSGGKDLLGGSIANIHTAGLSVAHSKQDLLGRSIANITSGILAPSKKQDLSMSLSVGLSLYGNRLNNRDSDSLSVASEHPRGNKSLSQTLHQQGERRPNRNSGALSVTSEHLPRRAYGGCVLDESESSSDPSDDEDAVASSYVNRFQQNIINKSASSKNDGNREDHSEPSRRAGRTKGSDEQRTDGHKSLTSLEGKPGRKPRRSRTKTPEVDPNKKSTLRHNSLNSDGGHDPEHRKSQPNRSKSPKRNESLPGYENLNGISKTRSASPKRTSHANSSRSNSPLERPSHADSSSPKRPSRHGSLQGNHQRVPRNNSVSSAKANQMTNNERQRPPKAKSVGATRQSRNRGSKVALDLADVIDSDSDDNDTESVVQRKEEAKKEAFVNSAGQKCYVHQVSTASVASALYGGSAAKKTDPSEPAEMPNDDNKSADPNKKEDTALEACLANDEEALPNSVAASNKKGRSKDYWKNKLSEESSGSGKKKNDDVIESVRARRTTAIGLQ